MNENTKRTQMAKQNATERNRISTGFMKPKAKHSELDCFHFFTKRLHRNTIGMSTSKVIVHNKTLVHNIKNQLMGIFKNGVVLYVDCSEIQQDHEIYKTLEQFKSRKIDLVFYNKEHFKPVEK